MRNMIRSLKNAFLYDHAQLAADARKSFEQDFLKADLFTLKLLYLHWAIATFLTSISFETYLLGFGGGL